MIFAEDSELPIDDNNLIDLKRDESEVVKVVNVDVHEKMMVNATSSQKSNISQYPAVAPSTSSQIQQQQPPPPHSVLKNTPSKNSLSNFSSRSIKHHTFDSGFQDVKNMEKNLISLLDDFHNGERIKNSLLF